MRILLFTFCLTGTFLLQAQDRILLDEDYGDWQDVPVAYSDPAGDNGSSNIDFGNLWISNDDAFVFFRLEVGAEVNLQDNNEITIYIDTDNNASTGAANNGIGAEIIYNFGDRSGDVFVGNNNTELGHEDIRLFTSPTVTSEQFEIAISRDLNFFGQDLYIGNSIKILVKNNVNNNTDVLPDASGGITYTFNNDNPEPLPTYSISQSPDAQIRILSYNVLFDNLFESNLQSSYNRIISSLNPDIIGFQEIYDHSGSQTANKVESFLPSGNNEQWYHGKIQPDIIAISRFPIISGHVIGTSVNETQGNGAFLIDLDPVTNTRLLFIVAHTPCCDNNFDRQREIDAIMAFVRNAKDGSGPITLSPNDPIVIVGDMNLVGDRQQQTTLITGDIVNENFYGSDFAPDWDGTDMDDVKPLSTNLPLAVTWYKESSSFSPGRLDYMLYSGSVMDLKNSFALFTPELTQDQLSTFNLTSSDATQASDHLPVVGDFDFVGFTISTSEAEVISPVALRVSPNPFSELSTITIELLQKSVVRVELLDANGRQVDLLMDGVLGSGTHELVLDGSKLVSGVYICQVVSEAGVISERVVVVR